MSDVTLSAGEFIVDQNGGVLLSFLQKWNALRRPPKYTVAKLPVSARAGDKAYATDLRVFDGAGMQETAGNGTGGEVQWNGTNWVIVGTNVTAVA